MVNDKECQVCGKSVPENKGFKIGIAGFVCSLHCARRYSRYKRC